VCDRTDYGCSFVSGLWIHRPGYGVEGPGDRIKNKFVRNCGETYFRRALCCLTELGILFFFSVALPAHSGPRSLIHFIIFFT
jgi:hypothetical protein